MKTMHQNLWDTAKAVSLGNFIALNSYIKKSKMSQIKDLMLHLKEKQEYTPNQQEGRNNEDQSRNKWNGNTKIHNRATEQKADFLKRLIKINKPLTILT